MAKTTKAKKTKQESVSQVEQVEQVEQVQETNIESENKSGDESNNGTNNGTWINNDEINENIQKRDITQDEDEHRPQTRGTYKIYGEHKSNYKTNYKPRTQYTQKQYSTHTGHNNHNSKSDKTSVMSFNFNEYASLDTKANELDTQELLKVLISRTFKENKFKLYNVLTQSLKAMGGECDYPEVQRQPPRNSNYKKSYINK